MLQYFVFSFVNFIICLLLLHTVLLYRYNFPFVFVFLLFYNLSGVWEVSHSHLTKLVVVIDIDFY